MMSVDDVHRALTAMDEPQVRDRLAAGDFTPLEGLALTEDERHLVQEAAGDYPEVAGFSFGAFLGGGETLTFPEDDRGAGVLAKIHSFKYSDIVLKRGFE